MLVKVTASSLEMARASALKSPEVFGRLIQIILHIKRSHRLRFLLCAGRRNSQWLSTTINGIFEELQRHQLSPATSVTSQPRAS